MNNSKKGFTPYHNAPIVRSGVHKIPRSEIPQCPDPLRSEASRKVVGTGFTFIEMLVVLAVLALTLPAMFSIIFIIAQQQLKIYALSEVKKQATVVMNKMESIQFYDHAVYSDAILDTPKCNEGSTTYTNDGSAFYLKTADSIADPPYWVKFERVEEDGNGVIKFSKDGSSSSLTSSYVNITSFQAKCSKSNPYSPEVIQYSFTISYKTSPGTPRQEEQISLSFIKNLKVKAY